MCRGAATTRVGYNRPCDQVNPVVFGGDQQMTTSEVVQRVLPLLERLSARSVDKARLLQYLSARASVNWGMLTYEGEEAGASDRTHLFRDRLSHELRRVRYPDCLPADLEIDVIAEYKRLALDQPLATMPVRLFDFFYRAGYCGGCRFDSPLARQICRECHFAGRPINFDPR